MKKEKRMNKVLIITISVLILVAAIAVVVFIMSRPQKLAPEEMPFDSAQISMDVYEGETEEIMRNQNYVENQVIAIADSKREAKKIAKAIDGELLSYDNQVAVIQIGITVEEMMQRLEEDSSLPKVFPNYQNYQSFSN